MRVARDQIEGKLKLNLFITTSHICLILGYTVVGIAAFETYSHDRILISYFKAQTAWTCIGGACDLFLTCMIWFVLDDHKEQNIFLDGNYSYAIVDVVKLRNSTIGEDSSDNDSEDEDRNISVSHSQRVSDLMIAQFFDQVEGPDRDWDKENY